MRRLALVLVLVLAIVAGLFYRRPPPAPLPAAERGPSGAVTRTDPERGEARTAGEPGGSQRAEARAKRDALRAQIAKQLASRAAAGATDAGVAPGLPPRSPTDPRPPGTLRDKLGGREALVERLNRDLMPLASECIEQALERTPRLAGMLAIGLETIADDQLGAVVEAAGPSERNEVQDPLLLECIRESAYSLSLPPSPANGREQLEITIPVEPAAPAGSGSGAGSGSQR